MKQKSALLIILLIVLCSAQYCKNDEVCNNGHPGLTIVNNSTRTITVEFYWNYPDTMIGEYNPLNNGTSGIAPDHTFTRGAGRKSCWEEIFADGYKEWIYIFDQDTLSKLDWSVVRQTNRGLLERRLINLEYLQQTNFKIKYPKTN